MQLTTSVPLNSSARISHRQKLLLLGSCFSENMGLELRHRKYDVCINPQGIVFQPLSMAENLLRMLENKPFEASELQQVGELWVSLSHHGRFSQLDKEKTLTQIQSEFLAGQNQLLTADYLLVTFGTAWAYWHKESAQYAANCHKIPQKAFEKRLLSAIEIEEVWADCLEKIWEKNPELKVIFTLSPVRHWRDGAVENQVSKSTLHLAIWHLCQKFSTQVHYFPAYEILLDELRDYRFYANDLLHPSETAIQYIWEKFQENYLAGEDLALTHSLYQLHLANQHRPIHAESQQWKDFQLANKQKWESLCEQFPYLRER